MTAPAPLPAQKTLRGVAINATPGTRPVLVDGCATVPALFRQRCQTLGPRTAHREKTLGIWRAHSWADWWQRSKWLGLGLRALGMEPGDVVSILSEDRKEWLYLDLAIQCMGGVCSGVYTTDSSAQLAYLLADSGSRFLVVENEEQLDKFLAIPDGAPGVERVIILDNEGLHDLAGDRFLFLDALCDLGRSREATDPQEFDAGIDRVRPDDLALLIYTSGTTGPPKGAMITQENILATIQAGIHVLPTDARSEQLCFLPLCHILERDSSIYFPLAVGSTVNFAESPETVFDNLREVSPHVFTAVPRVWEKIHSRVTVMAQDATLPGRLAFRWALAAGMRRAALLAEGRPVPLRVALAAGLADLLVFRNLRRMLGMDRLVRGASGAAPIAPALLHWYHAIGVRLYEGYGMTENTGLSNLNTPEANRAGSVGPAVPGVEIRIAADGEIQTRGLNSFAGYWRRPDRTAEAFTDDGWLRTGDVGHIDAQGFLTVTGRLKDIIITAGGKNITPAEIESRLKFSPYIADAVVIGDRRPYLTALVMIDQENVEKFAQDRRVPFSDFRSLCRAGPVVDLIGAEVAAVNRDFARVEQIKDFRLIDVLLTAEDEELTPTMKLRRATVESRHASLIDAMYRSPQGTP